MKTILVTGVSGGLGRAIAEAALGRGHRIIGTLRDEAQRVAFEAIAPGRAIGRRLDVTDTAAIAPLVQGLERDVGPIEVLVNNAGYGLRGVVEELDLDDLRRQFEVNLFGPVALTQAILPFMRERRRGHIVDMASMGGMVAFPTLGAYHATKFAMIGLDDALRKEVAPVGIRVTTILPGVYRSDWNARSQKRATRRFSDYDALFAQQTSYDWGDPAALGRVVVDAIEMEVPPEHLLVGPTALRVIRGRLADWTAEIDRWENLSEAGGQG